VAKELPKEKGAVENLLTDRCAKLVDGQHCKVDIGDFSYHRIAYQHRHGKKE
jgi:hypothetical protein